MPQVVAQWIGVSQRLASEGKVAEALEHVAGAAVLDIQQHQQTFLAGAFESLFLGDVYAQVLERVAWPTWCKPSDELDDLRAMRVLYVLGSVVQGQAACANVARLLESHAPERFEPSVLVVEEMTARTPPLRALKFAETPSTVVGAGTLDRMRASVGPDRVCIVPPTGTYLDGAHLAIERARAMRPDLAIFVGSPASPIQVSMAFARVAPVQVNLSIGVPMLTRGIDAVIYNNPRRQREDSAAVESRGIRVLGVPTSGGDAAGGPSVIAMPREALGVPAPATVLVSAANNLPGRMLRTTFAADLARFLAREPDAWWVGIGGGDFGPVREAMRRAVLALAAQEGAAATPEDVLHRVRFLGAMSDIRPAIKACDVLLNEYPEGGGNVVIEAMGCGVPVVAMAAGRRHAECIGAELVGPEWAIEADLSTDRALDTRIAAYWSRVRQWARDAMSRSAAGVAMQRRAIDTLDYAAIGLSYEACYSTLYEAQMPR